MAESMLPVTPDWFPGLHPYNHAPDYAPSFRPDTHIAHGKYSTLMDRCNRYEF
jgi:hypothetical protein